MNTDSRWIDCSCKSEHHVIKLMFDEEMNDVVVVMRVNNYKSFFDRLVEGMRYIFNIGNLDTMYDCFEFNKETAVEAIELLKRIK